MQRKTWKSKILRLAGSTLFGLSVIGLVPQANAEISPSNPVPAAAATATVPPTADGRVQLAQWGWGWGPPPPRYRRYPPRYRRYPPRYRRYPPPRRWAPPPRYGYRSNAHVRYCLRKYRSYNPRTDQYLGYDGRYHYCRSPYR